MDTQEVRQASTLGPQLALDRALEEASSARRIARSLEEAAAAQVAAQQPARLESGRGKENEAWPVDVVNCDEQGGKTSSVIMIVHLNWTTPD